MINETRATNWPDLSLGPKAISSKKVYHQKNSDEWGTPQKIFDQLNFIYQFTLDPCASESNAKCLKYFTEGDDGLTKNWQGQRVFMNPPYSNAKEWMKKAHQSVSLGNCVVIALMAARIDVKWFWQYVKAPGYNWYPIEGRLVFGGAKSSAPFPSIIIEMLPKLKR